MDRKLQIYVEGKRLDLFQDEKIVINSSIQNVNDISKVFTDLSQSFTIPANTHNNAIFHHFYNSDVDAKNDVVLNYNIRREALIEIDLTTLRRGTIQLDKANLKNGKPYSYTITFFGQLTSLKDKFGEDKLSDLDYSDYSHDYTGVEVVNRVTGATDYDVRYPLISSSRVWQYGSGSQNIGNSSHRINYTELFPALKINRIFDAIETKYGVTLSGNIRLDKRFDNCFLYLKNKDTMNITTSAVQVDMQSTTSPYFDTSTNEVIVKYISENELGLSGLVQAYDGTHYVTFNITPSISAQYYVDVYFNGQLQYTISDSTAISEIQQIPNVYGVDIKISLKIRSESPMSFSSSFDYGFVYSCLLNGTPTSGTITASVTNNTVNLLSLIDLGSLMPDMKVADFISGIIKEYNLTIEPISETSYKFETVDSWYAAGVLWDVTKHTDISSIDVERIKLYKKISFKNIESESFMNKQFKETNLREYGSLEYQFDTDGNEFTIDLPFENLLFNRLANNLQVGYSLTKAPDYKPYIPKPMLLFLNDQVSCDTFYLRTDTTTIAINSYFPFGQDVIYNSTNYSLNFGNDISSFYNVNIPNSMFISFYNAYLNNLFQRKNRYTYVKTKLPLYILTQLKLNDRLLIRDHRYIINEMKIDLTSGVVDFVLINDFSQVISKTYSKIIAGQQTFNVPISFPNGAIDITFDLTDANGATIDEDTLTDDYNLRVTVPPYLPKVLKERVIADGGTWEAQSCIQSLYNFVYIIKIQYNFPTKTTTENIVIYQQW
jgi:hypothetical protein